MLRVSHDNGAFIFHALEEYHGCKDPGRMRKCNWHNHLDLSALPIVCQMERRTEREFEEFAQELAKLKAQIYELQQHSKIQSAAIRQLMRFYQ